MTTFSQYNMPEHPTTPDEWEEVCVVTGDIYLYEDMAGRLFIDVPDMEEMAGEITVEKAKQMMAVLLRLVSKFEGAQIVPNTEEKK